MARVRDDEDVAVLDRVRAERDGACGFGHRDADPRLEPLPVGVDQRDERHRRAADVRGEHREVVEAALRLGIEDLIPVQRREPRALVRRRRHRISTDRVRTTLRCT